MSALGLHHAAWTRVSAGEYQAYRAKFMRNSSLSMFVPLVLIPNFGYARFLRRDLLRRDADDVSELAATRAACGYLIIGLAVVRMTLSPAPARPAVHTARR